MFSKLAKAQDSVERWGAYASAAAIIAMMLLTTLDVTLRFFFSKPIPGSYNVTEMMMVGVVYLAVAYVQQVKGHVAVDMFIEKLAGRPRIVLEIIILFLALFAFGLVTWQVTDAAWTAWVKRTYSMGLLALPFGPAKTALALGFILLFFRLITDVSRKFVQLKASQAEPLRKSAGMIALCSIALLLLAVPAAINLANPGTFTPVTVGWIATAALIITLLIGLPVSFAILLIAIAGYWMLEGAAPMLRTLYIIPYEKIANYVLSVLPLFIIMGHLANRAGFAESMYNAAMKWTARIPGSLAQATIVGGAAFAAACGSGIASCATLGKICIPVMRRLGVDPKLAIGTVASVGPIAQMIPPSIMMVIYGVITEQSIAKLLIAGVFPGIFTAGMFMVLVYIRCKRNPKLAPQLDAVPWKEKIVSLKEGWGIMAIGLIVLGGIYTGVFTPTEAGALGAFGAMMLGFATTKLKWKGVGEAAQDTAKTTGMIFLIIAASMIFATFLGVSRIPTTASEFLVALQVPRLTILLGVIVLYAIAGMFFDMMAVLFLTLPIIYPAMMKLGYDPIWFGVVIVHMCELSLITPPFGLNLFVLRGMQPEFGMNDIIKSVTPFIAMEFIILTVFIAFPRIATWLPSLMS